MSNSATTMDTTGSQGSSTLFSQWRVSYLMASQDIELRYRRSLLGPLWVSAALVVTVLALSYVFSGVFGVAHGRYMSYVATGLLSWQLISALVGDACTSIIDHTFLLQNAPLSLHVIAGRVVLRNAIVFGHNFAAIVILLALSGSLPTALTLMILPGVAAIFAAGYALVFPLGALCARFRDVPLVVQNVMQVIFFLTPIFWMPNASSHRPSFIAANPFFHLTQLIREPMLGTVPGPDHWAIAGMCCVVLGLLAWRVKPYIATRVTLWL